MLRLIQAWDRIGTKLYAGIFDRGQPDIESLCAFRPQILSTSLITQPSWPQDSASFTSCSGICFGLDST